MEPISAVEQRARFSTRTERPSIDKQIFKNEYAKLWKRARMLIQNITQRYVNSISSEFPIAYFEIDLHDLWYMFIETAKITPADEADADRLVNQVLYARELGELTRIIVPPEGNDESKSQQIVQVESAITNTSARIWIDLPYLGTDLRAAWATSMITMSAGERENLAGFTARLVGLGVCDSQLMTCALILFREALETPRQLFASDDHHETPLSEFVPAILHWLSWGGLKILGLCVRNEVSLEDDQEWAEVGELLEAGGGQKQQTGFNMSRWQFWKGRLEEVSRNTENEDIAYKGKKCWGLMDSWEQMTGGRRYDRGIARDAFFGKRVEIVKIDTDR